jgi:transcriptional regulator with PAS, ATPase and Fis domain
LYRSNTLWGTNKELISLNIEEIQAVKQRFGIIGHAPQLNHAIKVAIQVAGTEMTVLITGESGVGKESFSKIIHQLSRRKHGQFIAINCGAIPEGTIDSELFGHEKGAFTGAHDSRKGYFEVTNGGTIFLDEIGEMPVSTQARLLRVLENGEFIRVGSSKTYKTDVRVVAATNINLVKAVEEGKFREDLYYRLNTVPIYVPPLRERGDDILLLFKKFATDHSEKYRVKPIQLTADAETILKNYRFPGNIRQLKNIVEQVSVIELDRIITGEVLMRYIPDDGSRLPALYQGAHNKGEEFSERDLLYKILFDLRQDVTDLKKLVNGIIKSGEVNDRLMDEHKELIKNIREYPEEASEEPLVLEKPKSTIDLDRVEDVEHLEDGDDSLSIEKKEIELIKKALDKNNNKRKYAAQDLGISERTLYRKIKQYDIEN